MADSRPVIWSERAIRDLAEIHAHIDLFAPLAAQRFAGRLIAAVESLSDLPNRGRPVHEGVRELVAIRPYVVLYEVSEAGVQIVHVRNAARRPNWTCPSPIAPLIFRPSLPAY